ncbi:bifunctional acetate--CoA ligase family protein/GNAT family N-acetyltransferase [Streptomyces luteocolor]|uniref:bifunctional acetate--CoA ligase family protein/GNAT family N-acetyltransferase n=1 Tax=Streptomyces luteocolor TaxID=285500 RepID=UPI000A9C388C|nr:bifunctional GNAT family N-acetyltransferase/acetate--CoA ligase family protein [Streptomyces luteocolor]
MKDSAPGAEAEDLAPATYTNMDRSSDRDAEQDRTPAGSPRAVHALLADGTTARIRPVQAGDHSQLQDLYAHIPPERLRLKFSGARHPSPAQASDRACAPSRPGHRALLAETGGRIVGLGEYERTPEQEATRAAGPPTRAVRPATADISLAVAAGLHHRGIGTLLLEHLVSAARADGITAFTADALAENHEILKVVADLGLHTARHFEGPAVHCTIQLDEVADEAGSGADSETYLTAVETRGRTAGVASLRPLLRPESIVVIGAGRKAGSVGRAVLRNLRTGGYNRQLYAIHPNATSLLSVPCHPSVAALPQVPDLAVLAVPTALLAATAQECGKAGVRALVVITGGLGPGQAEALLSACRTYGMRLVGPNSLGVATIDTDLSFDATFAAGHPRPGMTGVAVQSGGVGIAMLGGLSRLGLGISSFVSLGEKYDVSSNDLLQWWESDGVTDLALLHLESFGNPQAFSRTARRVTRRIPVLTVDVGRTREGRSAAALHSAAAATRTMTRQALFTQAGITATRSIGDLLATAALLHAQPVPAGRRVVVVTNAGGAGVLAADACAEAGLSLPALPMDVVDDLSAVLPQGATTANPVDARADVTEEQLRRCVDRLLRDGCADAVLLVLVPTAVAAATGDDLCRALTCAPGRRSRTVAAVRLDQDVPVQLLPCTGGGSVPAYADPQAAASALAHAARRAEWLARPPGTVPDPGDVDTPRARAVVETHLTAHPDGGWLGPRTCAELLGCYGIPQLPWAWAETEDDAVIAAERLRRPDGRVVMKAHWPGLLHKSEQRALHLDLQGDTQVRAAFRDLSIRFAGLLTGVVVQPLAERGTELCAGVVQDDVFGPLVLFGLGGTATEVLADQAARLAPLTDLDVHDLITAPRCAPLLFGHGGSGPVDLEGIEQLLHRLSRMACDLPQLTEADLNPVLAWPGGVTALDARVRLLPRDAHDPYLRRLR